MSDLTAYISENNLGTEYPISKVAANEWKSFAMYTVESRAIPNMIDGLKPVQRFYLYSSILNSKKEFKKVSAVSGIISDYGYNHGESSAAGAGQLMAATWNNNICLIEGRGSFGTRLVQEAGAARYVYTRLSDNFNKYMKDIDLSPVHEDPEHEPPAFYLPIIPMVLVNGTKGIATGFVAIAFPGLFMLRQTRLYRPILVISSLGLAALSGVWVVERVFEVDAGINDIILKVVYWPRSFWVAMVFTGIAAAVRQIAVERDGLLPVGVPAGSDDAEVPSDDVAQHVGGA